MKTTKIYGGVGLKMTKKIPYTTYCKEPLSDSIAT